VGSENPECPFRGSPLGSSAFARFRRNPPSARSVLYRTQTFHQLLCLYAFVTLIHAVCRHRLHRQARKRMSVPCAHSSVHARRLYISGWGVTHSPIPLKNSPTGLLISMLVIIEAGFQKCLAATRVRRSVTTTFTKHFGVHFIKTT
jgi:hypothetical protein